MKKWVVTIYDVDGTFQTNHSDIEKATKKVVSTYGKEVLKQEIEKQLHLNGYFSVVDDYGRTIEVSNLEVGYCKVCKGSNKGLYGIRVSNESINVCMDCLDDFECGNWDLKVVNGKSKIVKINSFS